SGADTPVLATAFAPHAFYNLTMNQFDARQRYVEDVVGPPTFLNAFQTEIGIKKPGSKAGLLIQATAIKRRIPAAFCRWP
ncbi:hypothetical protein, partial [Pseudomonas sp. EA_65y_Pfl1_P113]|uniref:hypothetical protein n=1 Tax=Pseudomonas sp. EA_65y_Pfl1_P113 TaxID=3088692 RepID=UPI0030DA6EEF